jgi:hypothetical protein
MKFRRVSLLILMMGVVLASACATKTVQRVAYTEGGVIATLRHQSEGGAPIDRGFAHPANISQERLSAVLASILVRDKTAGVKPAVTGALVRGVARGLSQALEQADSSEEVALTAVRKSRRLGIFTEKRLTSLVAYVEDDQIVLSFTHIDWDLSKAKNFKTGALRLPQPRIGRKVSDFTVIPGDGLEVGGGGQAVKISIAVGSQ